MQRNNAIDFTRAIAMVIIVTCHFLMFGGVDGLGYVGRYLGLVGNFIFFAVSALLFGMVYEKRGADAFEAKPFMKKRIVRLFASLWPYLLIILPVFYFCGVHLNPVKVALNFAGLGWFGKLPDIGHIWFVTMIIFCYVMYVIYCNILKIRHIGGGIWLILLIISIILQAGLDYKHLPGTMFIILLYSLWIFLNSNKLIDFIEHSRWMYLAPATIVANGLAIYACQLFDVLGTTIVHWATYISGAFLFISLMKLGRNVKCGKIMMFLSLTGYEIYLVHHAFCSGTLSLTHITDYAIINYIILWFVSVCSAWVLKQIGDKLNSLVMNK